MEKSRISNLFDVYACRSSDDVMNNTYYFLDLTDKKEIEETPILQSCTWFLVEYTDKFSVNFIRSLYNLIENAFPDWITSASSTAGCFQMFLINYLLGDEVIPSSGITNKLDKLNAILNHVRMVITFNAKFIEDYFDDFSEIRVSVTPIIHYYENNDIVEITSIAKLYLKSKDLKKTYIRFLGAAKTDSFTSNRLTFIELLHQPRMLYASSIINLLFPRDFSCINSLLNRKNNSLREVLKEYVS